MRGIWKTRSCFGKTEDMETYERLIIARIRDNGPLGAARRYTNGGSSGMKSAESVFW